MYAAILDRSAYGELRALNKKPIICSEVSSVSRGGMPVGMLISGNAGGCWLSSRQHGGVFVLISVSVLYAYVKGSTEKFQFYWLSAP